MKSNLLLASLFVMSATGPLMGMDHPGKGRLNFQLDNSIKIRAYSAENMGFFIKPSEFLGKSIIDVVPLDDKDKVVLALAEATETKKTVNVGYTLEQKEFVAKITPLIVSDKKLNYFIKVQESKK
jgi:hypothetical protein